MSPSMLAVTVSLAVIVWLPIALLLGALLTHAAREEYNEDAPVWMVALAITVVSAGWPVWMLFALVRPPEEPPPEF